MFRSLPWLMIAALISAVACSSSQDETQTVESATMDASDAQEPNPLAGTAADQPLVATATNEPVPEDVPAIFEPWTGDLDGMIERRVIRALVTYSQTNYFLDGPDQKGITYEALQRFEKNLNEKLQRGNLKVHVLIIPVARDQLIPGLVNGRGDLAAANLTITPERQELVDFSNPAYSNVSELVVTGPNSPELKELHDLSGQEIHVRPSSSYFASLTKLNEEFKAAGKDEATLVPADEHFEDEDLLQMVNAGLIPVIVVDSHKARLWAQIFEDIMVHSDLAVRTRGEIGWAFRKDSSKLETVVNEFIRANRQGTLLGNILIKRYYQDTKWVRKAASEGELSKLHSMIDLFQRYGRRYEFDSLMLAALGYQESRLDQSVRSSAGAVGVMQLLPSTAADPNVGIPDIHELENNIHAGTKYLDFLRNRYFDTDDMTPENQVYFTFASYNAGPARVRGLREKARAAGLDPNEWFDNVEVIAAKEIGRETVQYVANITKYHIAYQRVLEEKRAKKKARSSSL